jgi:hypothetical protein
MRLAGLIMAAALAACASGAGEDGADLGPSPFPVERGSALPPPSSQSQGQAAPPEGRAAGGIDFGAWRQGDPVAYAAAFQTQMRARYADLSLPDAKADLEANGFACTQNGRLDCRIEIMERQCAFDWYVVFEPNRTEPAAGFDVMCLGAR